MKSVLISNRPKWCEKICHEIGTDKNGKPIYEKPIEVRKTKPSIPTPFKVYIYCTKEKPFIQKIRFGDIAISHTQISKNLYNGKVIGEFVCDKVISTCGWRLRGDTQQCAKRTALEEEFPRLACLTIDELVQYVGGDGRGIYGWHITDLKIYDKPKELNEFAPFCRYKGDFCEQCSNYVEAFGGCCKTLKRPPQSWCYVQELEDNPNVF